MKYKELSKIQLDPYDLENSINILKTNYGVVAPDSVIEQFYIDHNKDCQFNALYGELDITKIEWESVGVSTSMFTKIGQNASYPDYLEEVSEGAAHFENAGESVIDCREEVLLHWKKYGTWLTPPVLLDGSIFGRPTGSPHLVEGHSRVGCLLGVNKYKIIPLSDIHQVYWGVLKSGTYQRH